ncbi:MAG: lipocalin family protein, partial [Muribaculaceae bacterium]|nr:lipocalin family protein [Muribaculaceae bacterium]
MWILSRTPQISEKTKSLILDEAQKRGYDTSKLI